MTSCNHPAADQDWVRRGCRFGEFVAVIGSDLVQGEIWATDKIDKARDLCRNFSAATSRAMSWPVEKPHCPKCGAWWEEVSFRPASSGNNEADDPLFA